MQKKIRVANSLGVVLMLGVAIPFTILSLIHFPALILVPVLGIVISGGSILLNAAGSVYAGRVVISLLPITLGAAFQAGLTAAGEPPVLGIHLIELSFSVMVFLVFDLREKGYLIPLMIINVLIISGFDYINAWWEPAVDATVIREGYVGTVAILNSILFTFGSVFILVQQNLLSEKKTTQLLAEARENHQKMVDSEQELKGRVAQIKITQEEEKKRQWASEGLAQVSSMLRDNDDLQAMSDRLIAHIIQYVKANQGGLFVVDEEDGRKCIKLQACYAYERKKFLKKTIAIGEGLLGQAYLEKEYTYMTNFPEEYINITSGLGKKPPSALLIMPLMINDEVEGLLEIASFKAFEPYEIEFIQMLSENIAATLRNGKVNKQTKLLLAESQQQAEEMRAQEEEMRQNMEELQATQEQSDRLKTELEESQSKLQEKLAELVNAQQETEEVRKLEQQRAEEQLKARTDMLEKAVAEFKQTEQQLREEIKQKEAEINQLTTQ
ncbi:MAG: GAF domain-containing protein [Cyclobacteriaceae bacterium]